MHPWKPLLNDPAIHFGLIALVLWWVQSSDAEVEDPSKVNVSSTLQAEAWATFNERSGAPPNEAEWAELKAELKTESILVHEARQLGLDRNDPIIRKRLVQKMEILSQISQPREPSDEEFDAYLEKHQARYEKPRMVALEQFFFSRDKRGIAARSDAAFAKKSLAKGEHVSSDTFLHGNSFTLRDEQAYQKLFGPNFLLNLNDKEWVLVESPYGFHVAKITESRKPSLPEKSEVRQEVVQDWMADQRKMTPWLKEKLSKTSVEWESFEP